MKAVAKRAKSPPKSDAELARGRTNRVRHDNAESEWQEQTQRAAEEDKESKRAKNDLPKLYESDWSKQIDEAVKVGKSSADIQVGWHEGEHRGRLTDYQYGLRDHGVEFLRAKGYKVEPKSRYRVGVPQEGYPSGTDYWLEVSW